MMKNFALVKNYGITLEQQELRLKEQGDCCAICKTKEPTGSTQWHTDHDHALNLVRGILCQKCNIMIGHARDNPLILSAAIRYLKTFFRSQDPLQEEKKERIRKCLIDQGWKGNN